MCGINGVLGREKALVKAMNAIIRHRGPDQQGIFEDANVTLGSRRLSIIDLSEKGRMPMQTDREKYWIVFNGEIYNFKEIRQDLEERKHTFFSDSDTEVILRSYIEWGAKCVEKLNGQFAFCIYDTKNKELFLARDRLGIKPLFYYASGKTFAFSSEIKALLLHPDIEREVNWGSLGAYLTFRYVPGEETIIQGIRELPPGHTMLIDLKTLKAKMAGYWQADFSTKKITEREAIQRTQHLLEEAVERRMVADVPLGAFLSGGIDSSALVALMTQHSEHAVKTFSVGFDDISFSEVESSRLVADWLETDHTELTVSVDARKVLPQVIWHMDDLMADPAAVPTYLMSHATRKHVTVVLSGDGNDELHAGYWQYQLLQKGNRMGRFIPGITRKPLQGVVRKLDVPYANRATQLLTSSDAEKFLSVMSSFTTQEKEELLTSDGKSKLAFDAESYVREHLAQGVSEVQQWLSFDVRNWLPNDILVKSDRMSMAHSLELRVPYLDHNYVAFALGLPANMKLRGDQEKFLFKKAVKPFVPREVFERKKHGFAVPINEWMERGLKERAQEVFDSSTILRSGYFKQSRIGHIVRKHETSRKVYKRQFWNLLSLALWHRIHIEEAITTPKGKGLSEIFH